MEAQVNNGTTANGSNVKQTVYLFIKTVLTSGITIGAVIGVVYGYGALNNRVEVSAQQIQAHTIHLEQIDQTRNRDVKEQAINYLELKTTLKEQSTDIKWIVKQLKTADGN